MLGRRFTGLVSLRCGWLLAASLLALPLAQGCDSGPKLAKLETPAAGVTLAYDLAPGQVYNGRIHRSEVINSRAGGSVNRSIDFTANLVVLGPDDERGGTKVRATIANINLNWALPPAIAAIVNVSDLTKQAREALDGTEITFNVDTTGKIIYVPPIPEGVSQELGLVIQQALDALESAFYTVPERALKPGESWQDDKKRGRKGKLGRYLEGKVATTFDGLFADPKTGAPVAKLISKTEEDEVTTAKSGSHEVRREGESVILFATDGGYLASTQSELRTFDAGNSTTHTKVDVTWQKAEKKALQTKPETQAIDDPCHPDYVGAQDCVEQAPAAPEGAETQAITDPCHPDYVGAEACSETAAEQPAQ